MVATDVHQHRWSEPLVAALAARGERPRLRRRGDGWWLEIEGEPDSRIDVDGDAVDRRRALLRTDGVERALVAHSPALGIDALPAEEARAIAAAHAEGCRDAGTAFGWWAAVPLVEATPADVDAALDAGAVGVCLPSGALATPAAVEGLGPLLERLQARAAPLFVHPGPPPLARNPHQGVGTATAGAGAVPALGWWPALADYVPGMHVAWHAFAASGRAQHPRLKVLWAMLAGLAPLHGERLALRGGPAGAARDPLSFYDTSSYGAAGQRAMLDAVGLAQLVHGSDRPVVAPPPAPGPLGPDAWTALTRDNVARLLGGVPEAARGRLT